MPIHTIPALAQRVLDSNPNDPVEQRKLLEDLVELRAHVSQQSNPRACEYLSGAALLMTFMQHLGPMGGSHVLRVIATVLSAAYQHAAHVPSETEAQADEQSPFGGPSTWGGLNVLNDMLLGQILSRKGYIGEASIKAALEMQHGTGLRFGEALMKLGAITWVQLEEALNYQDAGRQLAADSTPEEPKRDAPRPPKKLELASGHDSDLKLMSDVVLGEVLLRNELITRPQLDAGLVHHRGSGMRIGEALVDTGACSWDDIQRAIELQTQLRRYVS